MLEVLGGRFLRRAFPQKVNLVPSCATDNATVAVEANQSIPGPSRVRRSAALIGLAISMGAYNLVAPQQSNSAIAAEPVTAEPANAGATAATSSTVDVAALPLESGREVANPTSTSLVPTASEHTVQVGQTLWRIAQIYKVNLAALAAANNLDSNSVLLVGQVLQIPARSGAVSSTPSPQGEVPATAPVAIVASAESGAFKPIDGAQPALKVQQDNAVAKLQDRQSRLKVSLAELKSEESVDGAANKAQVKEIGLASYRVNPGDTLSAIARAHGISYGELARLNRIDDPNLLEADQVLRVPQVNKVVSQPVAVRPQVDVAAADSQSQQPDVAVPVVPSLAAIQPTSNPATTVALVPATPDVLNGQGSALPARSVPTATPNSRRYVESLATEVDKLRQKYEAKSNRARTSGKLAVSSVLPAASSEVNPEFRPQHLAVLKAELRALQQRRQNRAPKADQVVVTESVQRVKPKLVARASVGSQSYAPIVNSTVGKMVSPELPPLGRPDSYLPNGAKFTGYIWPAQGVFTSGYGWRWGRMHKGIDIAAPIGTPVVAAAPGVVITAGWNDGGYGNLVEIQHPDGSITLYGHNDRVLVRVGQQVAQGEQIAEMGSTGFSTGPHSHFEVHLPGQGAVNPMAYLPDSRS
jgi:murein DD-endopeptidase MepM/ murein hydrolase activator NlpD